MVTQAAHQCVVHELDRIEGERSRPPHQARIGGRIRGTQGMARATVDVHGAAHLSVPLGGELERSVGLGGGAKEDCLEQSGGEAEAGVRRLSVLGVLRGAHKEPRMQGTDDECPLPVGEGDGPLPQRPDHHRVAREVPGHASPPGSRRVCHQNQPQESGAEANGLLVSSDPATTTVLPSAGPAG